MTEKQYLKALDRELKGLNGEDRKTIMDDYRDHFRQALSSGQSEQAVAESLGSPVELAEEAKEELGIEKFRETTAGNVVRVSMAGFSVLLFNAIFVIGPYAGLVAGMAGLWATALSVMVSGLASALAIPFEPLLRLWLPIELLMGVMPRIAILFGGITVAALGALACIGMIYLTRWFVRGTVNYAKMTWRIVTR